MAGRPPVYQDPNEVATPTSLQLNDDMYDGSEEVEGRLVQVKGYLWIVRGGLLQVFRQKTGECVSSWRARPRGARISHVCELVLDSGHSYLLLSVRNDRHSTIVMLPPFTAVVTQAVAVPHEVTCLRVVSASRLNTPGLFAHSFLSRFSGIVAVGCQGGHTYLVDLRLSDEGPHCSSLAHPAPLCILDPRGAGGQSLARAAEAVESGAHICIELSANCYHGRKFAYPSVEAPRLTTFPPESVAVTALHYAPQLCCLLVGFSFGSFQLHSLPHLLPLHSSPLLANLPPVTHFTLQEADNDPQCYCYLWVARGPRPPIDTPNREVKVTLHQLNFGSKTRGSGRYGVLYQNLQGCAARFVYALTATPSLPNPCASTSSRLLRCFTLERKHSGQGVDESHDGSHDEPTSSVDQTLAAFIWSSLDQESPRYFLGVFDINQWYHAQMPRGLQWKMSGRHAGVLGCSYFAFFSLNHCLGPGGAGKPVLDAVVGGATPFASLPPVPESHLWPSSLSIDLCGLTEDSVVQCSFYGLQRNAVHELCRAGPAGLVVPQRLFSLCESADLLLPAWDHGSEQSDSRFQRKALLSVALEHDLMSLLFGCSRAWMDGGSDSDLALLAEWAGLKVGELTDEKHRLCHPLFTGSAHLDTPTLVYFRRAIALLRHLGNLLHSILSPLSQLGTEQAMGATLQELLTHYRTTVMSWQLLEVIEWCVQSRLLPLSSAGFTYPSSALGRLYDVLRGRQQPHKLAIDHVVEELQGADDFLYPAFTFEEFLAVFTTHNTQAQHCLMIYFLCDVAALEEGKGRFQKLVQNYSAVFRVPPALSSLARGLWALDHGKFEEALRLVSGNSPGSMQWFPWQHSVVMATMLQGGEPKLALRYSHLFGHFMGSLPDAKLRVSILVAAECIAPALDILRPFQTSEASVELYTHFLDCCFQTKQLSKLVGLPLDNYEEDFLCGYLEDHPCLRAQELLVAFYLQRSRFIEARQMNEKIKPIAMADPDPKVKERSQFRDNLLAGYMRCLPSILLELPPQSLHPSTVTQRSVVECPAPLSKVLAKEAAKAPKSQATLIHTIMESIVAARTVPAEPVTPFRKSVDAAAGISGLRHTPFLSTPISVKRTRAVRQQTPVMIATPIHQAPSPGLVPVPEDSMISDFKTVMQNFMTQITQSGNASTLDTSLVRTPFAKTPPSFRKPAASLIPRSVATPPSILKVRRPMAATAEVEGDDETGPTQPAEGGGDQGGGANQPPRKIRFAVEGTLLLSPGTTPTAEHRSRGLTGRVLTPHVPPVPSSLTSGTQAALVTPLPSSDDSDVWESPVESPSQLHISPQVTPAQPSHHTPTLPHSDPKAKLFVGAEDDPQLEVAAAEVEAMTEGGPEGETGGEGESGDTEMEEPTDSDQQPSHSALEDTPKPSLAHKRALRMLSVALTRQNIGSLASGRSPTPTPHTTQLPPTSSHARPSPLVTYVQAASPSPFSLGGSSTFPGHRLATPILVSDLIQSKKKKLQSQLEEARRQDISRLRTSPPSGARQDVSGLRTLPPSGARQDISGLRTPPPSGAGSSSLASSVQAKVHVVRDQLSVTMVTPLKGSNTTPEVAPETVATATVTRVLQGTQFGFSPPARLVSSPPPVQSLQEVAGDQTPTHGFVFSPPLTRSSARRLREKSVEGQSDSGTTTMTTTTGARATAAMKQSKKGSRSRRSAHPQATEHTRPSHEQVSLVTPPTSAEDKGEGQRQHRRRPKPVKSSVGTRRSTRLLGERK